MEKDGMKKMMKGKKGRGWNCKGTFEDFFFLSFQLMSSREGTKTLALEEVYVYLPPNNELVLTLSSQLNGPK